MQTAGNRDIGLAGDIFSLPNVQIIPLNGHFETDSLTESE
jgi:hypothetical protein